MLTIGIDVGSTTSKIVLFDYAKSCIVDWNYTATGVTPKKTALKLYNDILQKNNLTKVDSSAYKALEWDSSIATQADIKGGKVSAPYVSSKGKDILNIVDSWAQSQGIPSINVNSMGRPPALQKFLKNTGSPAAATGSHHLAGSAIDLDLKDPAMIASLEAELKPKGYKVLYHGGHLHIEPA
jgi:hypothetical protein